MKMLRYLVLLGLSLLSFAVSYAGPRDLQFQTPCSSESNVVSISFIGDVLIHEAIYESVVSGSKNFSQIWQRTNGLMAKANFSVANLEGPAAMGVDRNGRDHGDIGFVYDGEVYSGTNFSFNYHPRILKNLLDSGFDLLTVANNHSLDRSWLGIDKTIKAALAVGIPTVGTRLSTERNGEFHRIVDIANLKVAFLGCSEMTNGNPDRKDQLLLCYSGKVEQIVKELAARSDIDAIVVLPHWGVEYSPNPSSAQKQYARRFLDAGAIAVMGSHPHVLQPWEKYITRDGRETLIAYSLGNFVAYQRDVERKTGSVAYMGLEKNERNEVHIIGVAYTPTYRDGTAVFPVGSQGNRSVLQYAATHFGTARRLDIQSDLNSMLCHK
jgi:poly-gamma-glutamate synthesis protein (capsule biosynthesis protein)